ncbi:MAG: RNA-directed DNA polymerase [Nitrospinae bacterium]|nr:RNA-directed DNA polymerase [Nitrospinota bacterium]
MSSLKELKNSKTLADLSHILGFSPQSLTYVIYIIPSTKKYYSFEVPKKNGGKRLIQAPEPSLKNLQRRLANLLNNCSIELDKKKRGRSLAHGFKKEHSIHTNAKVHRNKRYVLNFDIQDFFPSINFGRVRGYFLKNRDYALPEKIATIISQIACHDNQLPQGSPCSPVISNLIAHLLDVRLVKLAKKFNCYYSRYADDITFSTNQRDFPNEIAYQDSSDTEIWHLSKDIENQVARSGFKVNPNKTYMRCRNNRQVVTGLVVNRKVNVRSEYYRLARAMTHSLFKKGFYTTPAALSPIDIPEHFPMEREEKDLNILGGVLNFINYTRNFSDQRELREKQKDPTAIWKLFKRFLFFKYFGLPNKPLLVCEGPSDAIYIKMALKKLKDRYPSLINIDGDKIYYKIKFLKYSKSVSHVLQLSGGVAPLATFVGRYQKDVEHYPAWSPIQPVILLTDNDIEAKKVFSAVNQNSQSKPEIKVNDDFYYVNNNLYLVKTPHLPKKQKTIIEDLFDPKWLGFEIKGKKFSPENNCDKSKFYGKMEFAEKVIAKNFDKVSFDKFIPLLDRIVAAQQAFMKKQNIKGVSKKQN